MKVNKISQLFFICLVALSTSVFAMQNVKNEKPEPFVFNKDNYCKNSFAGEKWRTSKNGKIFCGIVEDEPQKVHVVKLPEKTLHASFDLGPDHADIVYCSPCGSYVLLDCSPSFQVWDIDKKERSLRANRIMEDSPDFSGNHIAFKVRVENPNHQKCGCDILIFNAKEKKIVAKYQNCIDSSPEISDNKKFLIFRQRGVPREHFYNLKGRKFETSIEERFICKEEGEWRYIVFDLTERKEVYAMNYFYNSFGDASYNDKREDDLNRKLKEDKSFKIKYLKCKNKRYGRKMHVCLGGQTFQDKLYKNKGYKDVFIEFQD